ncbi:MAG: cytochrome c biogenesis protein CcdA [bacterium]|nr:cytochrome c biogenesis protein CcdA [bacterium]MDD5354489.1 cytochrome c biogenesis protein CcdA [bacterium]MDD5755872.1 cytochrome c biogenesis protein CcdA [bacterium]
MMQIDFTHITVGTFLAVYGAGLVTSLTPCVYPILPIVIGFLGGREGSLMVRIRGVIFYVLGLSLVYTALGLIAALTGRLFGSLTANPYVYLIFGILILALAGHMIGWYYIPMPGLSGGNNTGKNSFFGPFFVGLSTGLVASPCTAPVLAGLLLFIATQKAVISGGLLMFTFSLGMSTLLLVIGLFAGFLNFLPKKGKWMVLVKNVLAFMLMGAGIYFIFTAGKMAG